MSTKSIFIGLLLFSFFCGCSNNQSLAPTSSIEENSASKGFVCGNVADMHVPFGLNKTTATAIYNTSVHWRTLASTNVTWSFKNYTTDTTQSAQIWIAHHAFSMFESESKVNFTYDPTGHGQIQIYFSPTHYSGQSNADGLADITYDANQKVTGGTIWIFEKRGDLDEIDNNWSGYNRLHTNFLHEMGHFIAFGHAFDDNTYVPSPAYNYSIMDYNFTPGGEYWMSEPCPRIRQYLSNYDIDILQQKYGVPSARPLLSVDIFNLNNVRTDMRIFNNNNNVNITSKSTVYGSQTDLSELIGTIERSSGTYKVALYQGIKGDKSILVCNNFTELKQLTNNGYVFKIIGYMYINFPPTRYVLLYRYYYVPENSYLVSIIGTLGNDPNFTNKVTLGYVKNLANM